MSNRCKKNRGRWCEPHALFHHRLPPSYRGLCCCLELQAQQRWGQLWGDLSPTSLQSLCLSVFSQFSASCASEEGEGEGEGEGQEEPPGWEPQCLPGGSSGGYSPCMKSMQDWLYLMPVLLSIGTRLCCLRHVLDLEDLQCYHGNSFCLSIGENVS